MREAGDICREGPEKYWEEGWDIVRKSVDILWETRDIVLPFVTVCKKNCTSMCLANDFRYIQYVKKNLLIFRKPNKILYFPLLPFVATLFQDIHIP